MNNSLESRKPLAMIFMALHFAVPACVAALLAGMIAGEGSGNVPGGIPVASVSRMDISNANPDSIRAGKIDSSSLPIAETLEKPPYYAEYPVDAVAPHLLLKVTAAPGDADTLYVPRFYGDSVTAFRANGKIVHRDDREFYLKHRVPQLSEAYLPIDGDGLYLLIEGKGGTARLGTSKGLRILTAEQSVASLVSVGYPRRVVGFFFLVTSLIISCVRPIFGQKKVKRILSSLSIFLAVFGGWIMFDFSRYDLWILKQFPFVPPILMVIAYRLSSALLNFGFVHLCVSLGIFPKFAKPLKALRAYALALGATAFVADMVSLALSGPTVGFLVSGIVRVNDLSITIGSAFLLVLSVVEAVRGNRNALIFSIGLGVCEISFIVSQNFPLLVSHWGVMALVTSFAVILTLSYNEARRETARKTIEVKRKNAQLIRLYDDLEGAQHEILYLLGNAVDLRSKETSNHVKRVSEFTRIIAERLGYPEEEAELMALASTLHDIGKVGISDLILNKVGKLTPSEFDVMKNHTKMGFDMLHDSEIEVIRAGAHIALSHHERFDGTGYPYGLSGDAIHPHGRIVAAADVLDALLNSRVYKEAWNFDQIKAYFKEQSARQFDPSVSDVVTRDFRAFERIHVTMRESAGVSGEELEELLCATVS